MACYGSALPLPLISIAFPLQQWLRERASMFSYTCIACLVNNLLTDCRVVMHAVTNFEMTNRRYTRNQRSERHQQFSTVPTKLASTLVTTSHNYDTSSQEPTNHIKFLLATIIRAKFHQLYEVPDGICT